MTFEIMLLIGLVPNWLMMPFLKKDAWHLYGLRRWMRREIDQFPQLSDERIDRALLSAEASVYRGQKRMLYTLPGYAGIAVGYVIARAFLPPQFLDPAGTWLYIPAMLVVLAPGIVVGTFVNRFVSREMKREFRNRLPEADAFA